MFHHIDKSDPRLEVIDLCTVRVIPVVAPRLPRFPISDEITPEAMRDYVQCVIRDTARHSPERDYYLIESARRWRVSDQLMKKELILQGMGWGHMPTFLVEKQLHQSRILSFARRHFAGAQGQTVAARQRHSPHGPVANRLWRHIAAEAATLDAAIRPYEGTARTRRKRRRS